MPEIHHLSEDATSSSDYVPPKSHDAVRKDVESWIVRHMDDSLDPEKRKNIVNLRRQLLAMGSVMFGHRKALPDESTPEQIPESFKENLIAFGSKHRSPVDLAEKRPERRSEVDDVLVCVMAEHLQTELAGDGFRVEIASEKLRGDQRREHKEPLSLLVIDPEGKIMGLEIEFNANAHRAIDAASDGGKETLDNIDPRHANQKYRIGKLHLKVSKNVWMRVANTFLREIAAGKQTTVRQAVADKAAEKNDDGLQIGPAAKFAESSAAIKALIEHAA